MPAGVTERSFKEKLSRVLGLAGATNDAATLHESLSGLMFGDFMVPGQPLACTRPTESCQVQPASPWHKSMSGDHASAQGQQVVASACWPQMRWLPCRRGVPHLHSAAIWGPHADRGQRVLERLQRCQQEPYAACAVPVRPGARVAHLSHHHIPRWALQCIRGSAGSCCTLCLHSPC